MTARKMGQVFYDMGFLSSTEVIECSASDLVGQYVGHTGPKTRQILTRALGKVLFVDEAYRLTEDAFAREAIDELVTLLTQDTFAGKIVVVLAGYEDEMRRLLAQNPGLASRFPEKLVFAHLPAAQCLTILARRLAARDVVCTALDPASAAYQDMTRLLRELATLPVWGNARDVETLAQRIVHAAYRRNVDTKADGDLALDAADALACVQAMLSERRARAAHDSPGATDVLSPVSTTHTVLSLAQQVVHTSFTTIARVVPHAVLSLSGADAAVAYLQALLHVRLSTADNPPPTRRISTPPPPPTQARPAPRRAPPASATTTTCATDTAPANEAFDEVAAKAGATDPGRDPGVSDAVWAQLQLDKEAALGEEIEDHEREARAQEKLQRMGVCVYGYRWIRQRGGYRCAGGAHFVSHAQLRM